MDITAIGTGNLTSATTGATTGTGGLFADTLAGIQFKTEEDRAKEKALAEAASAPTGAAAAFKDYMSKPLGEKLLEAWLGKHGMTKADFDALSPEEQQKILDQIQKEIKADLEQKVHKSNSALLGIGG